LASEDGTALAFDAERDPANDVGSDDHFEKMKRGKAKVIC
jgi:hypothetical protein